jgi:hypothetical protein
MPEKQFKNGAGSSSCEGHKIQSGNSLDASVAAGFSGRRNSPASVAGRHFTWPGPFLQARRKTNAHKNYVWQRLALRYRMAHYTLRYLEMKVFGMARSQNEEL